MSVVKWSEETTVKFVNEYVLHECLWNTKNTQYKNKSARIAAYKDVENAMNLPNFGHKEIINKIKNLRSTYSQDLKKIKESTASGAGTDNVYVPSLKWFSILDSVLRSANIDTRTSQSNLDGPESETTDESSYQDTNVANEIHLSDRATVLQSQPLSRERKAKDLDLLLNKVKDVSEKVNAPQLNENEFDIFGKNIAAQVKAQPLEKAIRAELFIQNYISNLRLQVLSKPSTNYVPPSSPSTYYAPSPSSSQTTRIPSVSPEENNHFADIWHTSTLTSIDIPISKTIPLSHTTEFLSRSNASVVQQSEQATSSDILATAIASLTNYTD